MTSSVLLSSAYLSPEARLTLLSPLATLLSNSIEALVRSAGELQTSSAAKRFQKLARTLITVHSSHLKDSSLPPADAFRTGALLAVVLVVTRYLLLKNRSEGSLGDAGLAKLRQTAAESQLALTAGERGALIGLLCEPEGMGAVRGLDKEGGNAVWGALYEAALRGVPFQEVDSSLGASFRRVELARRAVAMFRSDSPSPLDSLSSGVVSDTESCMIGFLRASGKTSSVDSCLFNLPSRIAWCRSWSIPEPLDKSGMKSCGTSYTVKDLAISIVLHSKSGDISMTVVSRIGSIPHL